MLPQFFFISGLHLVGLLLGLIWARKTSPVFAGISGFCWGMLLWVVFALFFLNTHLPFTAIGMFVSCAGAAIILLLLHVRYRWVGIAEIRVAGCVYVVMTGVAALLQKFNLTVVSFDSLRQMSIGRILAEHRNLPIESLQEGFANWGPFLPLLHSAAAFVGIDYLYALHPYIFVCLMTCFCYFAWQVLREVGRSAWGAGMLTGLAGLAMLSSYFFLYQAFYIHNNMPATVYVLVSAGTLWLALRRGQPSWLVFSAGALIAFILMRCEGVFFTAFLLLPLACTSAVSERAKRFAILPVIVVACGWEVRLLTMIGAGTDILTPGRVIAQCLPLIGILFLLLVSPTRWGRMFLRAAVPLAMGGLGLAAAAVSLGKPSHMLQCFTRMAGNLWEFGGWGSLWHVLAGLVLIALMFDRFKHQEVFSLPAYAFVLGVYVMGAFRVPYRSGVGDSANRILTAVVPLVLIYAMARVSQALPGADGERAAARRIKWRALALCATALAIMLPPMYLRPQNLAAQAAVIEEPPFRAPPMYEGMHQFEVALRGKKSDYAIALKEGPATVVLDLKKIAKPQVLLLTEYRFQARFTDYAWDVSADNQTWETVFDTRTPVLAVRYVVAPLKWAYDLRGHGRFRYVRLRFRDNERHILLLNRVEILDRDPGYLRPECVEGRPSP